MGGKTGRFRAICASKARQTRPRSILPSAVKPTRFPVVVLAGSGTNQGTMAEDVLTTGIARHGASRLPSVEVDSFNVELKDDEGFLGDRASKGAFRAILDDLRKPLKKSGDDPLGKKSTEEIPKSHLDEVLVGADVTAA